MQYLHAGYSVPIARRLTNRFALGFGLSVILWTISIFVPPPWQLLLWGLGLLIDFATPFTASRMVADVPPSLTHIPERVGLFTIIVFGEAINAVVEGLAELEWGDATLLMALLGLSLAFSLWWLYFDTADDSPIQVMKQGKMVPALTWLYIHLLLAIGLTTTGASIQHLIAKGVAESPTELERWLFCGAIGLSISCLAGIHSLTSTLGTLKFRTVLSVCRLGSAGFVMVLAIAGQSLSGLMLVTLVTGACCVQVILDLLSGSLRSKPAG
jgi:low temperature requirement protein LtrA